MTISSPIFFNGLVLREASSQVCWLAVLGGLLSALWGCTDAKLEEIPPEPLFRDDKLQVSGGLCTREPETLVFPLRVLFVVDASVSMEVTDPPDPVTNETGRERAVRETWERLLEQGVEGVRVGIIRFSAEAQSRTGTDLDGDGVPDTFFTADQTLLTAATQALGVTDRTTNYANALGEAYFELRTELMAADQESLPLSKYVVVFLSDGIPDTDDENSRGNAGDDIREAVRAIEELANTFRVGSFSFHTAYVSAGQGGAFDQLASDLLLSMSKEGQGTFRSFPNGEQINFLFVDFSVLRRVFTLKNLLAFNANVVLDQTQIPSQPVLIDAAIDWPDGEEAGTLSADLQLAAAPLAPEDALWLAVVPDWPARSCESDPCPDGQVCTAGQYCALIASPKVVSCPADQEFDPGTLTCVGCPSDQRLDLGTGECVEGDKPEVGPLRHVELAGVLEGDYILVACHDVGGELAQGPGLDCSGADDQLMFYRGGCPVPLGPASTLGPDTYVTVAFDDRTDAKSLRRVLDPNTFVDLNGDAVPNCGEPLVDSDGDGLADIAELHVGRYVRDDELRCQWLSDPLVADTDDDGLNDRMEWEFLGSGLHPRRRDDTCYVPNLCLDAAGDPVDDGSQPCACLLDTDLDGVCDCVGDPTLECVTDDGRDCVDLTSLDVDEDGPDGFCDCPDRDADGRCDYEDRDGDGLHDCEELIFGTAQRGADSDADGMPDPVEVRFLTSPAEADGNEDFDFDRTTNEIEVAGGTNPQCDDASLRSRVAYRYQLDDLGLRGFVQDQVLGVGDGTQTEFALASTATACASSGTCPPAADADGVTCCEVDGAQVPCCAVNGAQVPCCELRLDGAVAGGYTVAEAGSAAGLDLVRFTAPPGDGVVITASYDLAGTQSCYGFEVRNLTLVPTLARHDQLQPPLTGVYPGDGWNRIFIYAGEVAFDDPQAFASYRVACVLASYNPDGGFRNPPSGSIALTEKDFIEVAHFDPEQHCKLPGIP